MSDINGSLIVQGDVTANGTFKNFKPEVLAADPAIGDLSAPRLWFNSTTDTLKLFNGTAVVELGSGGAGGVTPEQLSAALADYTTTTALTTLLGDYVTDTELTSAIANLVSETALTAALGDYTAKTVTTALEARLVASFHVVDSASATTHTITHNLGYRYPVVQLVDAATNKSFTPDSIEFTTINELVVTVAIAAALKGSVSWVSPKV